MRSSSMRPKPAVCVGCVPPAGFSRQRRESSEPLPLVAISHAMSSRPPLSPKGLDLCKRIAAMFDTHAGAISQGTLKDEQLKTASQTYRELERFWAGLLDYGTRVPRLGATTAA